MPRNSGKKPWDAMGHKLYDACVCVDSDDNRNRYNQDATSYEDALLSSGYAVLFDRVKVVLDAHSALPNKSGVVIDAGCGSGLFAKTYGSMPSETSLCGFDISEEMLQLCKSLECYVDLKVANLYDDLPYPNAGIDTVVCTGVLGYINSAKPLLEFTRILKPGGFLFFTFREEHYERYGYPAALASLGDTLCKVHESLISPLPKDPRYDKLYIVCLYQKMA